MVSQLYYHNFITIERVKQLVEELNRHHGEYHLTHQMEDLGENSSLFCYISITVLTF